MKRRSFLKRLVMGAAFTALSRVLPLGQTEIEVVEEAAPYVKEVRGLPIRWVSSPACDPDRIYFVDVSYLNDPSLFPALAGVIIDMEES